MSLLIIGKDGFLGKHFLKAFPKAFAASRNSLDLFHPNVESLPKADFAIIAAAIANPKSCESDPEKSYQCNVLGTLKLCEGLLEKAMMPVLFSTDYVFDGQKAEYTEDSLKNPLNHYGRQKAELEEKALKLNCLIIRLSKVYGTEKNDHSLIDEMIQNFLQKKEVRAASDQIFAPIHIDDVIGSVMALLLKKCQGLYNLAGEKKMSRYDLATQVASKMGTLNLLKEISLDDLGDHFTRPKQTILICDKLKRQINKRFISIEESIDILMRNYEIN